VNTSDSQRLQQLENAEATRAALSSYCLALDIDDLDMLRATFAEDVVLRRPPSDHLHGRTAVVEFFAEALSHRVDHRKHFHTNAVVTHTGANTTSAHAYFFAFHHNNGELGVAWGGYRCSARIDSGVAVITELYIDIDVPIAPVRTMLGS
jgi:ketosteroid isomerase-like protein